MHYTTRKFWKCYDALPENVQDTATQCYALLKADPSHYEVWSPLDSHAAAHKLAQLLESE
jgi:hypothetical protein